MINKIKQGFTNQKHRNKKIISQSKYLDSGKYTYIYNNKHFYYNRKFSNYEFIEIMNDVVRGEKINKPLFVKIVELFSFLFPIKITNNNDSYFNGNLIMLNRNGDMKLFDLNKNILLTRYNSTERFNLIVSNINKFDNVYNKTLTLIDTCNKLVEEEIIKFKSYEKLNLDQIYEILHEIIRETGLLFNSGIEYEIKFEELIEEYNKSGVFDMLFFLDRNILKEYRNKKIQIMTVHGDLNFNNILYTKEKIYVIDWEDVTKSFILYDFFNILFVEALYHNNYTYVRKFMEGDFDNYIIKHFKGETIGEVLKNKQLILNLYILERFYKFEINNNKDMLLNIVDNYYIVYSKIISGYSP